MIDAKLKGEGVDISAPESPAPTNVVGLMAALRKSLRDALEEKPKRAPRKKTAAKGSDRAASKPSRKRA